MGGGIGACLRLRGTPFCLLPLAGLPNAWGICRPRPSGGGSLWRRLLREGQKPALLAKTPLLCEGMGRLQAAKAPSTAWRSELTCGFPSGDGRCGLGGLAKQGSFGQTDGVRSFFGVLCDLHGTFRCPAALTCVGRWPQLGIRATSDAWLFVFGPVFDFAG